MTNLTLWRLRRYCQQSCQAKRHENQSFNDANKLRLLLIYRGMLPPHAALRPPEASKVRNTVTRWNMLRLDKPLLNKSS